MRINYNRCYSQAQFDARIQLLLKKNQIKKNTEIQTPQLFPLLLTVWI